MELSFMNTFFRQWEGLVWLIVAILSGLVVHYAVFKVARVLVRRTPSVLGHSMVKHCRGPMRLVIPLLFCNFLLQLVEFRAGMLLFLKQTLSLLLIGAIAWLIIQLIYVFEDIVLSQFKMDVADNLRGRQIHTQIQILKKVVVVVVTILALATILMTFDKVRHLGTSILASAGIAGIIVGLAAQRSIATLLAGIQIALTQPIRIDDVVIVENEWGRIEEITLTYVVVRIWDLRRLIVPITYFIEKPFQNWTRISADLLGTVFLYADYTAPIQAIRDELRRIAEESEHWDGRVCTLQVTNATERTVELRALVSARDSSSVWQMRCEVREKLIDFLQKNYPHALPRVRAEIGEQQKQRNREEPQGSEGYL
jgi:small-conductance mechanosensitive channel